MRKKKIETHVACVDYHEEAEVWSGSSGSVMSVVLVVQLYTDEDLNPHPTGAF